MRPTAVMDNGARQIAFPPGRASPKSLTLKKRLNLLPGTELGKPGCLPRTSAGARLGEEPLPLPSHRGGEHGSYLFCGTRRLWLIRKSNWSAELDSLSCKTAAKQTDISGESLGRREKDQRV